MINKSEKQKPERTQNSPKIYINLLWFKEEDSQVFSERTIEVEFIYHFLFIYARHTITILMKQWSYKSAPGSH